MNLFELIFVVFSIAVSCWLGEYLVARIGWWGVIPAIMFGFGSTAGLIWGIDKAVELFRGKKTD